MEKKAKKSRLAGIPAWALSLITLFASQFLFIILDGIYNVMHIGISSEIINIIIGSIYPILIAVACFFICKAHPKSVWYTPIISNAYIIIPAIIVPDFWKLSFWTISYWTTPPSMWVLHVSLVLSVIGAIVGAMIGKRIINQET